MHDEVRGAVEEAIASYRGQHRDCPDIKVRPDSIRADGEWFQVVVDAEDRPARDLEYYDHLHAIDRMLRERGYKVALVPSLPSYG